MTFEFRLKRRARVGRVPAEDPRALRAFLRPYRLPLSAASALSVGEAALDLARPWPLLLVVDHAIGGKPLRGWLEPLGALSPQALGLVAAAVSVAIVVLGSVVGYITSCQVGASAERLGSDLRGAAFARLQHLSLRFHDRHRTGDLVTRLVGDVGRVQDSFVAWFETVLPEALILVGVLAVMFAVDVPLALITLGMVPVLALLVAVSRRRIKGAQRESRDRYGVLASHSSEVLRHVRAVQAFSRQKHEEARFQTVSRASRESALRAIRVEAGFAPLADVILAAAGAAILWIGVVRVTNGGMTLGVLLVMLSYLASVAAPVRRLVRLSSTFSKGAASRERLAEILAERNGVAEDPHPFPFPECTPSIGFREVAFGYRREVPVLRDLTLTVRAGETVCVVGPTGTGKSTLLSLLLRLYDPDEGVIEIGGVDIRRVRLGALRDRISFVPQDPWILDGTIAENVAFGRPGATREEIEAVCRVALVDEFATGLPGGLDSPVGEGGLSLSGGQRRRVALARALLREAPILLLDEPTTGLDAHSEALILQALARARRNRTVVVVAHDLRIAVAADRVVVLHQGRAIEEGAPRMLLRSPSRFSRMWALQNSSGHTGDTWAGERIDLVTGRR